MTIKGWSPNQWQGQDSDPTLTKLTSKSQNDLSYVD